MFTIAWVQYRTPLCTVLTDMLLQPGLLRGAKTRLTTAGVEEMQATRNKARLSGWLS